MMVAIVVNKPVKIFSNYVLDSLDTYIENTIIDGSFPADFDFRSVFYFDYDNSRSEDSQLSGFTIQGGLGTMITEVSSSEEFDVYVGGGVFSFNNHPLFSPHLT